MPLVITVQVSAWLLVAASALRALKRFYQNGWGRTAAKAVTLLYVPIRTVAMVLLLVWTVYTS